tara:strand:+ start:380 stop:541 length:162 start_codon:yes stop_codon:yes gene_type:complete
LYQEARRGLFLLLDHYLIARQNGEHILNGKPETIENAIWEWHNEVLERSNKLD